MKLFAAIAPMFLCAASFAQQPLTIEMEVVGGMYPGMTIKYFQQTDQIAAELQTEDSREYLIVDRKQKKLLEMSEDKHDDSGLQFRLYNWDDELSRENDPVTQVYDYVIMKPIGNESYRLLPEKQTMFGKECQKVEFLSGTESRGYGWMMPGVHFELIENAGMARIKEGILVESHYIYGKREIAYIVKKVEFACDPENFSFAIPEGAPSHDLQDE